MPIPAWGNVIIFVCMDGDEDVFGGVLGDEELEDEETEEDEDEEKDTL